MSKVKYTLTENSIEKNSLIFDTDTNYIGINVENPRTVLDISNNDEKIIIPRGYNSGRIYNTANYTDISGAIRFNIELDSFEVYSKEPDGTTDGLNAGNYNWRSISRLVNYDGSSEIFLGNIKSGSTVDVSNYQFSNITFKTNNVNRMTIHRDGIVEVDDDCSNNYPIFETAFDTSYIGVEWDDSILTYNFYEYNITTSSYTTTHDPLILYITKTYYFFRKDQSNYDNSFSIFNSSYDEDFINFSGTGNNTIGITGSQYLILNFDLSYSNLNAYSWMNLNNTDSNSNYVSSTLNIVDNINHIWVDGGFYVYPYYYFYEGTNDTPDLDKQYFNLTLDIQKIYRFHRIKQATTHPFYISNQGGNQYSSSIISLSGYGSYTSGITGNSYIDLSFNLLDYYNDNIISHKQFNITSHKLYYYCTSHYSMVNTFHLMNSRPYLKTSSSINTTNSLIVNNTTIDNTLTSAHIDLCGNGTGSMTENITSSSLLTINDTLTLENNANLKIKEHGKFKSSTGNTTIGTTDSTDCFDVSGDIYIGGSDFKADCLDISGLGTTGIYIPTTVTDPSLGHLRLNSTSSFYGHNDSSIETSTNSSIDLATLYDISGYDNTFLEYYNGDVWQNVDQGRTRGNTNSYSRPPYMVFYTSGMNLFTSSSLTRLGHYDTTNENYKISTDHPYLFGYADGTNGGILVNQAGVYMATFVARTSGATEIAFSLLKDTTTDASNNLDSSVNETSSNIEYLYKDDSLTWYGNDVSCGSINLLKETIFKQTFMFTLDAPSTLILKVSTSNDELSKIQLRITAMSFWDPSEITEIDIY